MMCNSCHCSCYLVQYAHSNKNNHTYFFFAFWVQRLLSPEEKYAAEGLASHCQGALSQKFNADEESMNG